MTKSPNAPIFLVLAFLGLIAFLITTGNLDYTVSRWFYGGFIFCAVISIFRRERGWIYSVVLLVVAAAMILWFWIGGSRSTTTLPVQR